MTKKVTENHLSAWVQLMRSSQHVHCSIETALKAEGYPGLDWYDVLLELKKAAPEALRPSTLEEKLLIKQYNLSRQLTRMVECGVLEKRRCPSDGRGLFFSITEKGLQQQAAMWIIYERTLYEVFGSKLTREEADELASTLCKLKS